MNLFPGEVASKNKTADFILQQLGGVRFLYVVSPVAAQDLVSQVPSKIDRTNELFRPNFGRIMPKTGYLDFSRKESMKMSREHIGRSIQFNRASQYVPLVFAEVREAARNWPSRS